MLDRNIPVYEGNLPYLYACYSPEDEMLVLPVLARMYNEGFRLWSACLREKVSDFVSVRHVTTASCVVMFMSRNMMERINSGVPEVLAACRSSLLRTVVLLDDICPDSRSFALTAPEYVEYQRSNDSAFWLHVYSADFLERCRGPWPEKKVSMREPTYEDVQEEAIAAEYISLDNIINRGSGAEEKPAVQQRYPNNRGYIQPQPDTLTYQPLGKVESARTVHDRDFDDALALLNQCAEKQIDIIINHTRPGENTVAAVPTLSPLKPLPDRQSELDIIRREMEAENLPAERPQRVIDPQIRTKADIVVEPVESAEQPAEEKPVIETLPQPELTVSSIAAGIRAIAEAEQEQETEPEEAQTVSVELHEESAQADMESDMSEYEKQIINAQPAVEIIWDDKKGERAEQAARSEQDAARASVQVVVRRQVPAAKVTPVKKRIVTEPVQRPAAQSSSRQRVQAVRNAVAQSRITEQEAASFEQYIRDIARSVVSSAETPAEQPVSHRRFGGRAARSTEQPAAAETSAALQEPVAAANLQPEAAEPVQEQNAVPAASAEEKTSRRKNRYPHNSEVLSGLIAALRRERMTSAGQEPAAASQPASETRPEGESVSQDTPPLQTEDAPVKVISLSDAISERRVSDLQSAVNKFMHLENVPEAAPLNVRAYLRRR